MPDPIVDRPSAWKKYQAGLCEGCKAGCCTMPVEVKLSDLVRLGVASEDDALGSLKKLTKRLIKERVIVSYRQSTELFMLAQKANDDCMFLGADRLCTVYEKRPDTCRQFPSIGPRPGYCPATRQS